MGRELEWGPAGQKKRVAVVGGGPGGLYARLGLRPAGAPGGASGAGGAAGRHPAHRLLSHRKGADLRSGAVLDRPLPAGREWRSGPGTRDTPELLRQLAPDAAILATGSGPLIPPIPGLDSCGFVTAQDMLEGRAVVGAGVLVVGGGMIGCEAAEFLGERGHRVAVVEMKEDIASDVRPEHRRCLLKNLRESQVLVRTGARVERFYPDGVDYVLADGTEGSLRGYDSVVLAMGTRSREELRERIAAFVPQSWWWARRPAPLEMPSGPRETPWMRRCPSETAALNKRQRPRRAEKSGGGALCTEAALGGGRPEKVPRPNRCLRFGATCRIIGKTVPRKGEGGGRRAAELRSREETNMLLHILAVGDVVGEGGQDILVPPPEGDPGAGGHPLHRGQRGERLRGGHNPPAGPGASWRPGRT